MKIIMALTILFLLSACGKATVLDVGEFAPYVTRFEQKASESGSVVKVESLIIRYGTLDKASERGVCEIVEDETPIIKINETAWAKMSDEERESLLFHEMGHCVLHRMHKQDVSQDGTPTSMMNPYMLDPKVYRSHKSYYYQELFSKAGEF